MFLGSNDSSNESTAREYRLYVLSNFAYSQSERLATSKCEMPVLDLPAVPRERYTTLTGEKEPEYILLE